MRRFGWLVGLLLLVQCSNGSSPLPPPQEPGPEAVGYYCGMNLREHEGPKGQAYVAGEKEALWFTSVRDTLAYLHSEGATQRLLAVYVNNMARSPWSRPGPENWLEAKSAIYVLDSRQTGGMGGSEIVPFATTGEAMAFVEKNGGYLADYPAIPRKAIFPESEG
ncbi:MAG: nitrous oxide reductase accessory protein NosL [Magnetococcales bacterium]|nr:nitrous oxide reductase accessory protein NosL [Magnetococcales bacterium]